MIRFPLNAAQRWWLMQSQARRRKGAFSPKNVPGLKLWVRAESLGLADDAPVAVWADESGNGANLLQAVEESKPTYQANVDGLPAVLFDGADDVLATAGNVLATNQHTIFLVAKPLASAGNDAIGTGSTGLGGDLLLMAGFNGVMRGHAWRSGNPNTTDGITLIHDSAFAVFEQEVSATTLVLRLSGVQEFSHNMAGAVNGASKPIYLGSRLNSWFFNGCVRALLVYEGNPTAEDKAKIRNYLISRYSVPTPYPPTPVPLAPSNLMGQDNGDTEVYLTWDGSEVRFELGYEIERKLHNEPPGSFVVIGTAEPDQSEFYGPGVAGEEVDFRVRAYNATGYSAYSNTATVVFFP